MNILLTLLECLESFLVLPSRCKKGLIIRDGSSLLTTAAELHEFFSAASQGEGISSSCSILGGFVVLSGWLQ